MITLLRVPLLRSPLAMLSISLAAMGAPVSSRWIPGKFRILSALAASNPPVVSFDEPLRMMIRSSGSPETFRLYSSPSTKPKRMHDEETSKAVPSMVMNVVFHLTLRLRTLYLMGIMGVSDHLPQTVDHGGVCRQERWEKAAGEAHEERDAQSENRNIPRNIEERQKASH